jgi:hypothetical protein
MTRQCFLRFFTIALAIIAGPVEGFADEPCAITLERARQIGAVVKRANPEATFVEYAGHDARSIIAELNARQPPTDWRADAIVVTDADDGGPLYVGLIVDGCLVAQFTAPQEEWTTMVGLALSSNP